MSAANGGSPPNYRDARAQGSVSFTDRLFFIVPAGTYATDIFAVLPGRIEGTITTSSSESAKARQQWDARLGRVGGGPDDIFFGNTDYLSDGDSLDLSEDFSLSQLLVAAGTTLTEDLVVTLNVSAGFGESFVTEAAATPPGESATATTDFLTSLRFLSVQVPEGITWTSASNAFLIPIPAALPLFLSGVASLGLIARRRRRKL